jgi:2-polyprenyl-3-methyl-5-hydroxy-6-metoxy-1,4-benzoquinol methylase
MVSVCGHQTPPNNSQWATNSIICLPAGMRCVELGAGVGLVGLALAAMGARVTTTDLDKVLPLMRDNMAANGFDPARG